MLDWSNVLLGGIRDILIGFQKCEPGQMNLSNEDENWSENFYFSVHIIRFVYGGYENKRLRNYNIVTRFI
jgi:hypothetical protein